MFREFKVGDLFETNPYRGGRQVLTGGNVPTKYLLPGNTPRISVTSKNNGIIGYYEDVDMKSYRIFENAISVSFLGTVFYHSYRASYDMKVHCLRLKDHELRECEALYLVSVLKKLVSVYNYSNQLSSTEIVDLVLSLPVKEGTDEVNYTEDDIDWSYIESTIRELEASTIRELDAYLKETGLDDYQLTEAERSILDYEPTFKEFEVGELFEVTQGRRLKKSDFQDGDIPFVMASSRNNGVVAHLSNPVTTNENFITADILGNVFYHDGLVGFGDDNCGLKLKNGKESETIYLYLVGVLSGFKSIASYGNKLRGKWYQEQFIHLPVKSGTDDVNYTQDDIDWDYMDVYVRAMEKQVITDVVDYKNEVIARTKELVKN